MKTYKSRLLTRMIDPVLIKLLLTSPSKTELLVTKALLESHRRSWKLAPTNGRVP